MKEQIKREIGASFIPSEYYYKGTTKKQIFLREIKKLLEREKKYENNKSI